MHDRIHRCGQRQPFTYAPFGPLGRLFWALPPLVAVYIFLSFVLPAATGGIEGFPSYLLLHIGVFTALFVLFFLRVMYAITVRDDSVEFHMVLGSWRVRKEQLKGVWALPLPDLHLAFTVTAPFWTTPWLFMRAFYPWPDHDPYQSQLFRLFEYLEANCPHSKLGNWRPYLPDPPAGPRVVPRSGGCVDYLRRPGYKLLVAVALLVLSAACTILLYEEAHWYEPPRLDRFIIVAGTLAGVVLIAGWWSLLRTSMRVSLGKEGLQLRRFLGRATAKWVRITALRDGGFRHNGLTYLPGCGYAKLQYVGEDGRSRSLVIPPVFWLSDEFRKALLAKLEESGRPRLVIE